MKTISEIQDGLDSKPWIAIDGNFWFETSFTVIKILL